MLLHFKATGSLKVEHTLAVALRCSGSRGFFYLSSVWPFVCACPATEGFIAISQQLLYGVPVPTHANKVIHVESNTRDQVVE